MTCLQVNGFAGLELRGNGHSVHSFPTHHVEELLGYLLLNQNKPYGRDYFIELLWPYGVSENSRGCLNTVLWRLRGLFRQMGFHSHSFLSTTRDQIIFTPGVALQFDVDRFEYHLERAWAAEEDTVKVVELTKAIDLYQGDLYAGIYADWCLIERERLARKYLQALGELMYCHIRLKDFAQAIVVGQTIIKADPLREEVHQALIFCYGRLGRRAEAAAQFQQCADYLMTEVQVLPMPDTVTIYQQGMTTCMTNTLDTPNSKLMEQANRAHAKFLKAGAKLQRILDEIENLKSAPIP